MNCAVCSSESIFPNRIVDGVAIYQCSACAVAFVDDKTLRKNSSHIYSFPDYQKREKQFEERYKKVCDLIYKYSSGKRILEVGAGFGLLSGMLQKEGYQVDALEPDVDPVYLRNTPVRIFKSYLNEYANKTKERYDVIILFDVLEHVDDPRQTVNQLVKLLRDKGIVIIQTPNYQSLMANIVRHWSWWMVEDHRFFFSHRSLDLLFGRKGWKNVFYRTYEEWADFKKNLDGNFTQIQNAFARKLLKAAFFILFIPVYFVGRHLLWRAGKGGLHMAIWQYNKG